MGITERIAVTILLVCVVVSPGRAMETGQLASPEAAVRLYLSLVEAGNFAEAKGVVSPRVFKILEGKGHSDEEYFKGWGKHHLKEVRNIVIHPDKYYEWASAEIILTVAGEERSYGVTLVKKPQGWMWDEHKGFYDIDSPIDFKLVELSVTRKGEPKVLLVCSTDRTYPSSSYKIRSQFTASGFDIKIVMLDVEEPTAGKSILSPASVSFPLDVADGNYNLSLVQGTIIDRYLLEVSSERIRINGPAGVFSRPRTRSLLRYPRNSFVYLCGTVPAAKGMCEHFHQRLMATGAFKEFTFPGDGEVPYPIASGGHYYDAPARYYTYSADQAFSMAGKLLREYARSVIGNMSGVGMRVINWKNEEYTSWMPED